MTQFPDRFGPHDNIHLLARTDDPGALDMEGEWLLWMNGPKEIWDIRSCEWSEEDETHVVRFSCTPSDGEAHDEEVMLNMVTGDLWRVRLVTRQANKLISLTMADGSHMIFRRADPRCPPFACPARGGSAGSGRAGRNRKERNAWGERKGRSDWEASDANSWWNEGKKREAFRWLTRSRSTPRRGSPPSWAPSG